MDAMSQSRALLAVPPSWDIDEFSYQNTYSLALRLAEGGASMRRERQVYACRSFQNSGHSIYGDGSNPPARRRAMCSPLRKERARIVSTGLKPPFVT